jgi:hypothetical protein
VRFVQLDIKLVLTKLLASVAPLGRLLDKVKVVRTAPSAHTLTPREDRSASNAVQVSFRMRLARHLVPRASKAHTALPPAQRSVPIVLSVPSISLKSKPSAKFVLLVDLQMKRVCRLAKAVSLVDFRMLKLPPALIAKLVSTAMLLPI